MDAGLPDATLARITYQVRQQEEEDQKPVWRETRGLSVCPGHWVLGVCQGKEWMVPAVWCGGDYEGQTLSPCQFIQEQGTDQSVLGF